MTRFGKAAVFSGNVLLLLLLIPVGVGGWISALFCLSGGPDGRAGSAESILYGVLFLLAAGLAPAAAAVAGRWSSRVCGFFSPRNLFRLFGVLYLGVLAVFLGIAAASMFR